MKSIHDAIKKSSLALFRSPKRKVKSKSSRQLTVQRNNTSLFGRLYVHSQSTAWRRPCTIIFSHMKIKLPLPLCLILVSSSNMSYPLFDIWWCCCGTLFVFKNYQYLHRLCWPSLRTLSLATVRGCMQSWLSLGSVYFANSIKGLTREHRGSGVRTKVSSQTKIPKKWEDFLRDSRNKTELFSFLTVRVGYWCSCHSDWQASQYSW